VSIRKSKVRVLGAAVLALPLVVGLGAPAHAATAPAGAFAESYGLLVDDTLLEGAVPVNIGPEAPATSSCPPAGGTKSAQVLDVGDSAVARAQVINDTATTDCSKPSSKAVSNIATVDALGAAEPLAIHADAVTAKSETTCTKNPTGNTDIVNLTIGGQAIDIPNPIPPNTEVNLSPLVGINIILNEQHPASEGRGLVVNAIHVIANASGALPIGGSVIRGDIIIAHAVSGVVCPNGPGGTNGDLPKPDISFAKDANPDSAKPGDTVTYSATITNQSADKPCEVLKFVDHIAPVFELVSTAGPLGTKFDTPPPARSDGGVDAVLRPTGVTIGAKKSVTQTFTVKVKDDAAAGTYYNTMEIFCGPGGNFVSGPLAPVTVTNTPVTPETPGEAPPPGDTFAPTGLNTGVPALALLLILGAAGARRFQLSRRSE
jgi:uncharacterized repeat protein (TIGR01451 family)